jgi:hypothetical protein
MQGMKLQYNDGNGTQDIITFLGIDYIDDMQFVCMIRHSDDTKMMVAPELLNFIANPDIASIPQTILDYYEECRSVLQEPRSNQGPKVLLLDFYLLVTYKLETS